MSPALLAWVAACGVGAEAPPAWEVCLVEEAPVAGASAAELGDALSIEARKRGRGVHVRLAPDVAGCGPGAVVETAEPVVIVVAGRTLAVAVATLRPVDRAAEVARRVAALLEAEEEVGDRALVGALPPAPVVIAPPVRVATTPAVEPASGDEAPDARLSLGLALATDPGESSVFGRLEVQIGVPLAGDWLALAARIGVGTPAVASRGVVEARRVELGGHGVIVTRGTLGAGLALVAELDVGAAYRWTSGRADELDLIPAASVERGEAVASLGGGVWLTWEPSESALILALGVAGRRYLGGTDLVAPAGGVDAPRWALDGGLRVGARL